MVRLWSEEVGNAKSVIEPLIKQLDAAVEVEIAGGAGFRRDTVEVRLKRAQCKVRCVVTFEAWEQARRDPTEFAGAFRRIIDDMAKDWPLPAYVLTTRGLHEEPAETESETLRTLAAWTEADVLAEQLPKERLPK